MRITENQPIFQTQIGFLSWVLHDCMRLFSNLSLMIVLVCLSSKRKGPMIGAWQCMPAPVILKHALNRMLQNSKYGDQSFILLQKYFMKSTSIARAFESFQISQCCGRPALIPHSMKVGYFLQGCLSTLRKVLIKMLNGEMPQLIQKASVNEWVIQKLK